MNSDPAAIRLNVAENRLTIEWQDGHVCAYDGAYLRFMCPCANCRGHAPGEVDPPRWREIEDVRVKGAEAVGTYAIRFEFSDGHETGIYAFAYLREICPSERQGVDEVGRPLPPPS